MKIILLLCVVAAWCQLSFAQRTLTDRQWEEDLQFMVHRIDSVHPNVYRYVTKEEFQQQVEKVKENIPVSTDNEIITDLMGLITLVHDGHTRLHGNGLTRYWYPVRLEHFSDGYYITASAANYAEYIGSRVTHINGLPVDTVFARIRRITPHDNEAAQTYFAPLYLTMNSITTGLHITRDNGPLVLTIEGHTRKELTIEPITFTSGDDLSWYWRAYGIPGDSCINIMSQAKELPLYLRNYEKPFWFQPLPEKRAVYFGFNACEGDAGFGAFNRKLWNYIDSVSAEYLIVDLRNNFGGTNSILMPFIHALIKHDSINRKGHLFVLIGNKTFSAAVHCATWIEFHGHPIFVGEATAAGPNHYADPDFSYLPNSHILFMVSRYYWQNSWPWDDRTAIEPAYRVPLSSGDYFGYHDPVMKKVLEMIQ